MAVTGKDQAPRQLRSWVGRFAREASTEEQLQRFVDVVDRQIMAEIPAIADDPVLAGDLHLSTRHQWLSFLGMLGHTEHRLVLPPQAVDLAHSLARRGLDVGVLLKVYLAAHRGVFEHLGNVVDLLGEEEPPGDEVLRFLWSRADLWMDDSVEALIESFYEERQRLHEGAVARRAEMIDGILGGEEVTTDEASRDLGHPLSQWQTAYVVWTTLADGGNQLRPAASDVARALGGRQTLTSAVGTRDLWCWTATTSAPDEGLLADLATVLDQRDVHVAVGISARGVEGFRRSHREARAAQHLALRARTTPRILRYRDVELLCLAMESRDLLEGMVLREVGPLCGEEGSKAQIRETVLTYLDNRMNVDATAGALFIHPNTVRYRLGRAEEHLGHSLNVGAARVQLALQYVSLIGAPTPRD
jgi:hypothetical protein